MKFKNVVWTVSNDDILSLCKLLDKVTINRLLINNDIKVNGVYKVVGFNVEFDATLTLLPLQSNVIYVKVADFQLGKKSPTNPVVKKSINLIVGSITSVEGISYDNKIFKIELEKLLNSICEETNKVKINNLYLDKVLLSSGEIQFNLNLLDIKLLDLTK